MKNSFLPLTKVINGSTNMFYMRKASQEVGYDGTPLFRLCACGGGRKMKVMVSKTKGSLFSLDYIKGSLDALNEEDIFTDMIVNISSVKQVVSKRSTGFIVFFNGKRFNITGISIRTAPMIRYKL